MEPIKAITIAVIFSTLSLLAANSAEIRHYNLQFPSGGSVPTTINWQNISGNAGITGTFYYEAAPMTFRGSNPSSGYITLTTDTNLYMEFRRKNVGSSFQWVAKTGERLVPKATGGGQIPQPGPSPSPGFGTVKNYIYTDSKGQSYPATFNWTNIKGLGPVSGNINGVEASGSNSRSGYLELYSEGYKTTYKLNKQKSGDSFAWVGTGYHILGNFTCRLTPSAGFKPAPPAPSPANRGTKRSYNASGVLGNAFVSMTWQNIQGLGPISGTIFINGGNRTFTGQNSSSGYINFTDSRGAYYQLYKNKNGGKIAWSGTANLENGNNGVFTMISQ